MTLKTTVKLSTDINSLSLDEVKKELKDLLKADVFTKFNDLVKQYATLTSLAFSAENAGQKMYYSDFKALLLAELSNERIPFANKEKQTYMTLDSIINTAKQDMQFNADNFMLVKQCKAIKTALGSFDTDSLFKKQAKGRKTSNSKSDLKDYKDTNRETLNALAEHLMGSELDAIAEDLKSLLDDAQIKKLAEILFKIS